MYPKQWEDKALDSRLLALATNFIRECRRAYNRDEAPWTDDDARRLDMVFKIGHLAAVSSAVVYEDGANQLMPSAQAEPNPVYDKIQDILERGLSDAIEDRAVKANLPKAKTAAA